VECLPGSGRRDLRQPVEIGLIWCLPFEMSVPGGHAEVLKFIAAMTLHSYWTSKCAECPLKTQCTTGKERRIVMLGFRRECADRHVFDHASAQRADRLVGHGMLLS
jgi:hypothetical protein